MVASEFRQWLAHLFLRAKDRLLVIVAYMDETGHPSDPQRHWFGLGGFVGRCDDWTAFAETWKNTCPSEFYPFHMKDFVRQTQGNDAKQREVLGALVPVITKSHIVPISAVCHVCGFRAGGPPLTDDEAGRLYEIMLGHVFAQTATSVLAAQESNPIPDMPHTSVVFAQRRFASRASDVWWMSKETGSGLLANALSGLLLKSVSIATPDTVPPLQAADFLAWEVGHHYERGAKRVRWLYEQFRNMPSIKGVASPSHDIVGPEELYGRIVFV